jgi:hypothetical protein
MLCCVSVTNMFCVLIVLCLVILCVCVVVWVIAKQFMLVGRSAAFVKFKSWWWLSVVASIFSFLRCKVLLYFLHLCCILLCNSFCFMWLGRFYFFNCEINIVQYVNFYE